MTNSPNGRVYPSLRDAVAARQRQREIQETVREVRESQAPLLGFASIFGADDGEAEQQRELEAEHAASLARTLELNRGKHFFRASAGTGGPGRSRRRSSLSRLVPRSSCRHLSPPTLASSWCSMLSNRPANPRRALTRKSPSRSQTRPRAQSIPTRSRLDERKAALGRITKPRRWQAERGF